MNDCAPRVAADWFFDKGQCRLALDTVLAGNPTFAADVVELTERCGVAACLAVIKSQTSCQRTRDIMAAAVWAVICDAYLPKEEGANRG